MQTAPSVTLLRQALANKQSIRLKISSGSMEPLLREGDTVVVFGVVEGELMDLVGEIITFDHRGELFTHRLIYTSGETFQTVADRTGRLDPELPAAAVLGRVIARERRGESVAFTSGWGQRASQKRFRAVKRLLSVNQKISPWLHRPVYWIHHGLSQIGAKFY